MASLILVGRRTVASLPAPLSTYALPSGLYKLFTILQLGLDQVEGGHSVRKAIRLSLAALAASLLSAPALAQSCNTVERSVLLILDASGSMNAKLPNGETRIAVAQRAIKGVAGFIPAQAQLSLRMYGAQSVSREKNCQDTHLAVPFGAASAAGSAITTTVNDVKAQGYTPIAYSLEQAAVTSQPTPRNA